MITVLETGLSSLHDRTVPPPRRIQKARQATKAARALLRLAPTGLKRQARGLAMALSGARRCLGNQRDRDAIMATIHLLAADVGLAPRRIGPVLKPLRAIGAVADDRAKAAATLAMVIAQIKDWRLPRARAGEIIDGVEADHRRLRRDARPGLARLDTEDLHDLRKRAIIHRHQMALIAAFLDGKARERLENRVERARRLHEAIGDHRDLHLAAEYLRTLADAKSHALRQQLLEAVARSQKRLLKQSVRHEQKLDNVKPAKAVAAARQRLA